ncbi:hypothetical protein [Streptomyces sp. NPDC001657]|uniref:hypothetical protein n=1 Tax=Streptomyces sp. NPDC001657 TaxID=3154522 RepID=UPI00332C096A
MIRGSERLSAGWRGALAMASRSVSARVRIRSVYWAINPRRAGTSSGQMSGTWWVVWGWVVLGWAVSGWVVELAAAAQTSSRSGGVSVPSEWAVVTCPRPIQPSCPAFWA